MITNQGFIGAQLAFDHAERVTPGWGVRAYDALVDVVKQKTEPFTIEQIREAIAKSGVEPPPDQRAYGAIVMRAKREKVIAKTGDFAPARSSHGSPKPLWVTIQCFA
ncbi:hypothetical protein ACO0K3_03765 [Undibacterium sp. Rencai35W]|uniref:hypothetical protein n=1 Tax=Undibacterium sp. Rencai35W TaxID=3413046 RepID=UPI003BF3824A